MTGLNVDHLRLRTQTRTGSLEIHAHLSVGPEERVAWVAPSGSGKSTVLKAIAGIPNGFERISGQIRLSGVELSTVAIEKREIAFVMQELHLFSELSVIENAEFALRVRAGRQSADPEVLRERREQTSRWLKRVGLGEHLTASVDTLSGGERQRLALVRALIAKPKLILLDEPFSALDPDNRVRCLEILDEFWSAARCPCLIVTHDAASLEFGGRKFLDRIEGADSVSLARGVKTR